MNSRVRHTTILAVLGLCGAAIVLMGTLVAPADSRAKSRRVPVGFLGADLDPWRGASIGLDMNRELAVAAASGVETIRFPLYWSSVQTGPRTYVWKRLDGFVEAAARRSITLIPTVMDSPKWTADRRYSWKRTHTKLLIPNNFGRYANFVALLAKRYGPKGSFWSANPSLRKRPITTWQVWNEPDLPYYWPSHAGERQTVTVGGRRRTSRALGWAPTYIRLVSTTRAALRRADPKAQLMLGSTTNMSWRSLRLVYASGARGKFDLVGVNIFTKSVPQLKTALGYVRREMNKNGDRKAKITVTELSWLAAKGKLRRGTNMSWIVTTPKGQASQLKAALWMLSDRRFRASAGIAGAYWYSWASTYTGNRLPWNYSGLRRHSTRGARVQSTPALATFRSTARLLEGR